MVTADIYSGEKRVASRQFKTMTAAQRFWRKWQGISSGLTVLFTTI